MSAFTGYENDEKARVPTRVRMDLEVADGATATLLYEVGVELEQRHGERLMLVRQPLRKQSNRK
jgi:hypothetical protein